MTRTGAHPAAALLTLVLAVACGSIDDQGADRGSILFERGEVYTLDPLKPWAEAVVVEDGVITYVGDRNGAETHTGSATRVVDLDGGLLLPGFIDTHAHLMMAAGATEMLQMDLGLTPEEILREVEQFARKNPERMFLIGGGFGVAQFGRSGPHRRDLDRIVPDRPVVLIDDGGHSAWLNSAALEAVGIGKDTPDPIPGVHYYAREEDGEPTGWLLESQTFMPALAMLGAFSSESMKKGAEEIFPLMSSLGVTTVFEAGMSVFEDEGYEALVELEREGRLPFRVVGSHIIQSPAQVPGAIERIHELQSRYDSELISVGMLKIHNDGTKEAHTAALLEPYLDDPGNRGAVLLEQDELTALVVEADTRGIDLHIHAIGDRTIHQALDAIAVARGRNGFGRTRHTICHLELIGDEDLDRFLELDVIAQTTPYWHSHNGEAALRALGRERFDRLFRFRSLAEVGVRVTFGSDFPASGGIQGLSPLYNIEVGHTRRSPGVTDGPLQGSPAQALEVETLIRGYTIDAAYQLRLEDLVGSIEVGKRADLILLDRSPLKVAADEIHTIKVRLTLLDGRIVHERGLRHWIADWVLGL